MLLWSAIVVKRMAARNSLEAFVGGGGDVNVQGELRLDDSSLVKDSLFTVQEFIDRLLLLPMSSCLYDCIELW